MVGVFRIIQCIIYPFSSSTTVLPCYGPYLIPYQHITVKCACKITWHSKTCDVTIYIMSIFIVLYDRYDAMISCYKRKQKVLGKVCTLYESTCIARTLYLWEVEDWVKSGRVMRSVSQAHPHNHRHPDHRLYSSIIIYIHIYSSIFIYIHMYSSIFIFIRLYSSILIYIQLLNSNLEATNK